MKKEILRTIKENIILLLAFGVISSCKKFIEVEEPYTSFNGENVYKTDGTAISAVTAMYTKLGTASNVLSSNINSITYYAGLSADELIYSPGTAVNIMAVNKNELSINTPPPFWSALYSQIYLANA